MLAKQSWVIVRFAVDFEPLNKKKGETMRVTPGGRDNLHKNHDVIDAWSPDPPLYKVVKKLPMQGWYPTSVHMATYDSVKEYLDDGSVVIDWTLLPCMRKPPVVEDKVDDTAERLLWWFKGLDYSDVSEEHCVASISLALQCTQDKARSILEKWKEWGQVVFENGKLKISIVNKPYKEIATVRVHIEKSFKAAWGDSDVTLLEGEYALVPEEWLPVLKKQAVIL